MKRVRHPALVHRASGSLLNGLGNNQCVNQVFHPLLPIGFQANTS